MKSRYINKELFFMVAGVLSILYYLAAASFKVAFASFFLIVGILCIAVSIFNIFLKKYIPASRLKGLIKISKILVAAFIISFVLIQIPIIFNGMKNDKKDADYIVVLGAGMWGDVPSLTLSQRLEKSLEVINEHPKAKIIVSGGMGPGETITEAEGMKRFLVKKGVNENRIIKEDKSRNTEQNLKFSKAILDKQDNRTKLPVIIVTSDFHMFRAKMLAEKLGFTAYGAPSPIHPLTIPACYVREYFAVIKSVIFDIILK